MDYNNLLKDQTALITAGADGIGYGIAKRFEEAGAKVFVCDINEDAVNQVNSNHTNIKAMVCDLRQTHYCKQCGYSGRNSRCRRANSRWMAGMFTSEYDKSF